MMFDVFFIQVSIFSVHDFHDFHRIVPFDAVCSFFFAFAEKLLVFLVTC